jgi:DNA polymerase IV (DinB-like DNA polymerase)
MTQDRRRTIFHVDVDAFYASVEIRDNPALRGKPVVVGADPEGGKARGVVVACSYEARKYGLKSGMPISRAYRLCPSAVYIRPDFKRYIEVSNRVMEILRRWADKFEQVGIDEAFLDVSSRVAGTDEAKKLALRVKEELREKEGLTCSVGIAENKSAAKIASDLMKPDGLTLVPQGKVAEFLAPLPVSVIPGVGKKTRAFLQDRGIETISQLQQQPGKQLVSWFGKNGVWLWGVVHGKEEIEVRQRETPRSLSVEKTFRNDVEDYGKVYGQVETLAHELNRRVKKLNLQFKTIGVKIRFSGFETHTTEKSFTDYSESLELLLETTRSLLQAFEAKGRPVRLVGVRVSNLRREESKTSTIDSWS